MSPRKSVIALLFIPLALAALSGCGRKGDLLTPSQAAVEERKAAAEAAGEQVDPAEEAPAEKPKRRFILDALID